jgi:hypothetical protein
VRDRLCWPAAAIVLGLASALLPNLSLGWYLLYPYPLIPSLFWLSLGDLLGMLFTSCLAFVMGPIFLFVASPSLFGGVARTSKKDFWVLIAFSILEVVYLLVSWKGGYKYVPGPSWTNLTILISLLWLVVVWFFYQRAKRSQSYRSCLVYKFAFVLWLIVYAFPWLGEMP